MVETQGTPSTRRTGTVHTHLQLLGRSDVGTHFAVSADPEAPFSPPSAKSTGRRRAGGEFL